MNYTPLEDLLAGKVFVDTDVNNFRDGICELISAQADGVTYKVRQEFLVNNIAVLERVADNKVKYEIQLRDGDILSEFESDVRFIVSVGHLQANPADKIVVVAAQYSVIKVAFFLDPEEFPETFYVSYKVHLLDKELRQQLASAQAGISSGSLAFVNGMAVRCH